MSRVRVRPSVILSAAPDGYLAYDIERARLHHLNPTAALVVELCEKERDLDALRAAVVPLVGDSGWSACRAWIDEAIGDGLLEADANSESAPVLSAEELSAIAVALRDDERVLAAFVCQAHAAELAPDDSQMWYRLGELAHIVGRRDDARAAYGRYIDSCPDDAEIVHILKALRDETPPPRAPDAFITQLYGQFASFYDENMSGELEYQAPDAIGGLVERTFGGRRNLDVIELGCGTGLCGVVLRPWARQLTGVDLSPAMLDRARARGLYDALQLAEITRYLAAESSGPVDLIVACDTLIYFGDLRQVVQPAVRRLAPGGVIAFTVEHGARYPFLLDDSGRFTHHPDHLVEVAGEAGLAVVDLQESTLRYEYGNPVRGIAASFRRVR